MLLYELTVLIFLSLSATHSSRQVFERQRLELFATVIDLVCLWLKIEFGINWLQYRQWSLVLMAKLPYSIAFMLHCRGSLLELTSSLFGLEINWDVSDGSHPESTFNLTFVAALVAWALCATGEWITAFLTVASFYYIYKWYVTWVSDQFNLTTAWSFLFFFLMIRWLWQLHISHTSLVLLRWSRRLVSFVFKSVN